MIAAAVLTALALAGIAAFRIDISAARDFRADMLVIDGFPKEPVTWRRFADPSPFTIWIPFDWFVHDSIRAGHLPLWEPLQGGGYAPLVGAQSGVLHPLRWLASAFPRETMPSVLIVAALSLAAIGTFLFCVEVGLPASGAAVGALLFPLSSAFLSYAHFSGGVQPLVHLPWIAWAYRRALRLRTRRSSVLVAVLIGLLFAAGHPLIALSVCAALATLAAADAIAFRRWAPIAILAGAAVVGTLVAAPSLLPGILAVPDSWSYKVTDPTGRPYVAFALDDWQTLMDMTLWDEYNGTCCIDDPPFFAYLGPFAIALAIVALFTAKRFAPAAREVFLLALIWFAIASPGPWMAPLALVKLLSFWKPWYLHGVFAFFLTVAAAHGFARLLAARPVWRVVAVVVAALPLIHGVRRAEHMFQPRRWEPVVRGPIVDLLRADHTLYRVSGGPGAVQVPNTARLTGIPDVRLSAPAFSQRFRLWWVLVDPLIDSHSYPTTPMTHDLRSPLVGDFGVKYVLQSRTGRYGWFHSYWFGDRDVQLSPFLGPPRFPLIARSDRLELHRNASGVRPRVHFAERVVVARDLAAAFQIMQANRNLVTVASVVETDALPRGFPQVARGSATVTYPDNARATIETVSDTGGLVVLHDAYAPGWTATLDGQPTDVLPVNILSRGILSPPGRHHIELSYMPPGLAAGAAMSAVTLLGCFALVFIGRRSAPPLDDDERQRASHDE